MRIFIFGIAQHSNNGDLTLWGWATAVAYVVGAILCERAARVTPRDESRRSDNQWPWSAVAAVLLFLGVNKLLNLQTVLIHLGREVSWTGGWYQDRRTVQVMFVLFFTLALVAALAIGLKKWGRFLKERPAVLVGILLLSLFVVIRASAFNHLEDQFRVKLHDDDWSWALEWTGILCIAGSAALAKTR
ncbi:MAG: hypothetical protein ACRD5L_06220 [Bryobacteraceae bacterium]